MKFILCASFIIFQLELTTCEGKFKALIFDRFKKSLIQASNEVPIRTSSAGWKWALACPALNGDQDDENFNEEKSFSKNALFVRGTYDGEDTKRMPVEICDKPFKLSIALFEQKPLPLYYEFGYDINFNHSDLKNFQLSNKAIYKSLEDTLNLSKLLKQLILIPLTAFESSTPDKTEDKGFMWIPLFKMINYKGNLSRIKYEIHKNNRDPFVECQDYNLGKEMFGNIDADSLYSAEVQKKSLEGVSIPGTSQCEICFEKWLLIPADQFQFGSPILPSCSNMATIPIWSSVVKGLLKKLDKYLYAFSKVTDNPLSVVAGIHKSLRLPSKSGGRKNTAIALKRNGVKIHVPYIIYKLVTVKILKTAGTSTNNIRATFFWYSVLIVIHNDPTFETSERICEDKSTELGWEDITFGISSDEDEEIKQKSDNIYVCVVTPNIMKQLGLKYDKKLSVEKLSLKDVPYSHLKDKTNVKNIKNVKEMISRELKQRFQPENESEFENKVIERPLLDDDDNIITN